MKFLKEQYPTDLQDNIKWHNKCIIGFPERQRGERIGKTASKKKIIENFDEKHRYKSKEIRKDKA